MQPLTARSIVASTLLGIEPPRLTTRLLVRSGELFGITPGTTRVALSRMVAAGELEPDDNGYRLAGHLLARQARQSASRSASRQPWAGDWSMAVVASGTRPASDRARLRAAMRSLHLAEQREGFWLRPANLERGPAAEDEAVVDAQCRRFTGRPDDVEPERLVAELWDLEGWKTGAARLRGEMARTVGPLDRGDTAMLAPGFELSAAVLRHFLADPLLPHELLPDDWPGDDLRTEYDRFDRAFKRVWRDWFSTMSG